MSLRVPGCVRSQGCTLYVGGDSHTVRRKILVRPRERDLFLPWSRSRVSSVKALLLPCDHWPQRGRPGEARTKSLSRSSLATRTGIAAYCGVVSRQLVASFSGLREESPQHAWQLPEGDEYNIVL